LGKLVLRSVGLVAASLAALVAPGAAGAQDAPAAPTLQLEPFCEQFPPYSGVKVTATVAPPIPEPDPEGPGSVDPHAVPRIEAFPSTPGLQFLGLGLGGVGGLQAIGSTAYFWTDESGLAMNAFGAANPNTYTANVVWAGGTVSDSLFVDCRPPLTKESCKKGGWREWGFRNQGQCIAWVKRERD
jgi:hypothetical protein